MSIFRRRRVTTPDDLGECLANEMDRVWPTELEAFRSALSPTVSEGELYLVRAALYYCSWIRASSARDIRLRSETISAISHSLSSFLVVNCVRRYGGAEAPDAVLHRFNDLAMTLATEAMSAHPHFPVACAVHSIASPGKPIAPLEALLMVGSILHSDSMALLDYLRSTQAHIR